MTTHSLNPARAAIPPVPPQQQDHTERLLRRWTELTALTAAAAAHRPGEEFELFTAQQQVEMALRHRSPRASQVLDDLISSWETQLAADHHDHTSGAVTAARCLVCRRARLDAAVLPAQFGGAL